MKDEREFGFIRANHKSLVIRVLTNRNVAFDWLQKYNFTKDFYNWIRFGKRGSTYFLEYGMGEHWIMVAD